MYSDVRSRFAVPVVIAMFAIVLLLAVGPADAVPAAAPPSLDGLWTQMGADIDGEAEDDRSGSSVATSDDANTVIVGAPGNDDAGDGAGHARVYRWDEGAWTQLGADIDGEAEGDRFGESVAMSGDGNTVIVGAPRSGGSTGHASVYRWDEGAWTQLGADIAGEAEDDRTGTSVAMSGDGNTFIVGEPQRHDDQDSNQGRSRVFRWDGSAWAQRGPDINGVYAFSASGVSVAMSNDGDTIIVGEPWRAGRKAGRARVYRWDGNAYAQLGTDIDGEAEEDGSGSSVAMSGDGNTVIIGAPFNFSAAHFAGHARVYRWDGNTWTQLGADIDGEAEDDEFGSRMAMARDGNTVIIGARFNDGAGVGAGHAQVYRWDGNTWMQHGADIRGEAERDESGSSVSISADGSTVIVGAVFNDGSGINAGHARVWSFSTDPVLSCGGVRGTETALAAAGYNVMIGTGEADLLRGTAGSDFIIGLDGADIILAGLGDDVVCAGAGHDVVVGSGGSDSLHGEDGNDRMSGGPSGDVMTGGRGKDSIIGGSGDDEISGDEADDTLLGSLGDDVLRGGDGKDTIRGDAGNDWLFGDVADDVLGGSAGVDVCDGGTHVHGDRAYPSCETAIDTER